MKRDYKNYDYLSVSVRNDQFERILSCYNALGWRVVRHEGDRQYYNMKFVVFRRPHKIENKDRLQYLQVRMENAINSISVVAFKRHRRSTVVGIMLSILMSCLFALGMWLFFWLKGETGFVAGIISLSASAAVLVGMLITLFVMRKKEDETARSKIEDKVELLMHLIEEAESLAPKHKAAKTDGRFSLALAEGGDNEKE